MFAGHDRMSAVERELSESISASARRRSITDIDIPSRSVDNAITVLCVLVFFSTYPESDPTESALGQFHWRTMVYRGTGPFALAGKGERAKVHCAARQTLQGETRKGGRAGQQSMRFAFNCNSCFNGTSFTRSDVFSRSRYYRSEEICGKSIPIVHSRIPAGIWPG